MTSHEFAEASPTITRRQALNIVRSHCIDAAEFDAAFGVCDTYDTLAIIVWLGY